MRDREKELQLIIDLAAAWCEDWQEPIVDVHVVLGCYGHAYNWGLDGKNDDNLYLRPTEIPHVMDGAEWLWDSPKWDYYVSLLERINE